MFHFKLNRFMSLYTDLLAVPLIFLWRSGFPWISFALSMRMTDALEASLPGTVREVAGLEYRNLCSRVVGIRSKLHY